MKTVGTVFGIFAIVLAISWAFGFVEFTYPNVIPNDPLVNPRKVREFDGTNMALESGEIIGLSRRFASGENIQQMLFDISNQVSRSDFEVDVESSNGNEVEIYVRHLRKFRDSVPPFTIPLIRETVGRKYREPIAFGIYLSTNSKRSRTLDGNSSDHAETNQVKPVLGSGLSK